MPILDLTPVEYKTLKAILAKTIQVEIRAKKVALKNLKSFDKRINKSFKRIFYDEFDFNKTDFWSLFDMRRALNKGKKVPVSKELYVLFEMFEYWVDNVRNDTTAAQPFDYQADKFLWWWRFFGVKKPQFKKHFIKYLTQKPRGRGVSV